MRQTFPRLLIALCAAQLAGCAVGPDFAAPTAQAPAAWHGADPTVGVTDAAADDGAWWTGFHDPEMTSLISRAAAE